MNIISYPSPNFNERLLPLQYILLHYTDLPTLDDALRTLTQKDRPAAEGGEVSAHYCIARDGRVFQLVANDKRAWHAGRGSWQGVTDMNSASIGIEMENPGHSHGYVEFTNPQIDSLIGLLNQLVLMHGIHPHNIIGHSDYAPGRKQDPGHLFPWDELARLGLGMWPSKKVTGVVMLEDEAAQRLQKIGYDVTDFNTALQAFQRHFCPRYIGQGLTPETMAILAGME